MPLPNSLLIDSTPNIYHLVELKDTYDRYVVMISTENHARILEVNLGAVTRELWTERPELRERVGREWTREHYLNHRRDRGDQFIREQIAVLGRLMSQGGHTHLILAGNPRIMAGVRGRLPKHLAAKLIDIVPASASAKTDDIVAATLSSFIEWEEQDSVDVVALLVRNVRRNGLAVTGTSACLEALERGQVDMLLMAGAFEPPPGWGCRNCWTVQVRHEQFVACSRCGGREGQSVDLKAHMAALGECSGSRFELVRHSDAMMALGGVGCLLRYLTSDQG